MRPRDERRGDLVRGHRTLTGQVERTGECTVLVVGNMRWVLLGQQADSLRTGAVVRVSGTVSAVPTACRGDRAGSALTVLRIHTVGEIGS